MEYTVPNGIMLLHQTKDYTTEVKFEERKIILHVTYSDGTEVQLVTENNTSTIHVLNRDIEILADGRTAQIIAGIFLFAL